MLISKLSKICTSKVGLVIFCLLLMVGCAPQEASLPTAASDEQAKQTLITFYSALQSRDYEAAASLFSPKSGIGRSDLLRLWNDNDADGWRIIDFEITDQRRFDNSRIVYFVVINQEGLAPEQYSTSNVLHFDNDQWLVGNATLDKVELNIHPRTKNNITIIPGILLRTTSGIEIWINVTNASNQTITWGVDEQTCAKLLWADFTSNLPCSALDVEIEQGQVRDVQLLFDIDAFEYPDFPEKLEISILNPITNSQDTWEFQIER